MTSSELYYFRLQKKPPVHHLGSCGVKFYAKYKTIRGCAENSK